jgi:hypothetical protein
MSFFSKLFKSDKTKNENQGNESKVEIAASATANDASVNSELIAVITAAVMAVMSSNAASDLMIRSIRRVGRNSPVWNIAGRDEYLMSKL